MVSVFSLFVKKIEVFLYSQAVLFELIEKNEEVFRKYCNQSKIAYWKHHEGIR